MGNNRQKSRFTKAHKAPTQPPPPAALIPAQSRAIATTPVQIIRQPEASSSAKPKQSMAQKRAAHALEKVGELERLGKDKYGLYVSYVKALPATIRLNGLGQAMAMEKAKAKEDGKLAGHKLLFAHVSDWLLVDHCHWKENKIKDNKGNRDIFVAITQGSQEEYLRAHAEALAYLDWLKKFAVAMLVEPENKGDA